MAEYTTSTGTSGTMSLRDDGTNVEFWIKADPTVSMDQLPWVWTIKGQIQPWRSFKLAPGGAWQRVDILPITTSQTLKVTLGATGTLGLGGPTDLVAEIQRGTSAGTSLIRVGSAWVRAQAYVNVAGVWKPARPLAKSAGYWREAS